MAEQTLNYNPKVFSVTDFNPNEEVYWKEIGDEKEIFRCAFQTKLPFVLKGPTGCGKTTFVRRMHLDLGAEISEKSFRPDYVLDLETGIYVKNEAEIPIAPAFPLYIIDGTEDTEIIHLLGGYTHTGQFVGGPMYHWAHTGGILLLNELAELRGDVQTIFNSPLEERTVTIPELGRIVQLPDHAMFVPTYNPGYQAKRTPLKISTKQRLPGMEFGYPSRDVEAEIVYNAANVGSNLIDEQTASKLANLADKIRSKDKENSVLATREGVSTRLLVMAGKMIGAGLSPAVACQAAIVVPLANNRQEAEALEAIIEMCGLE